MKWLAESLRPARDSRKWLGELGEEGISVDELDHAEVEELLDAAANSYVERYAEEMLPDFMMCEASLSLLQGLPHVFEANALRVKRGQTWRGGLENTL
mmetsp:Transcript_2999/g.9170  ORF Transcript_2999/g.9170 Transcript_2999/m.9170 type:complete len:98 (+) Transcript_2999:3-296(+)